MLTHFQYQDVVQAAGPSLICQQAQLRPSRHVLLSHGGSRVSHRHCSSLQPALRMPGEQAGHVQSGHHSHNPTASSTCETRCCAAFDAVIACLGDSQSIDAALHATVHVAIVHCAAYNRLLTHLLYSYPHFPGSCFACKIPSAWRFACHSSG